jgi:hypothetical protein
MPADTYAQLLEELLRAELLAYEAGTDDLHQLIARLDKKHSLAASLSSLCNSFKDYGTDCHKANLSTGRKILRGLLLSSSANKYDDRIGLGHVFPFSIPDPQGIEERCSRSASARRLIEAMPRNPLAGTAPTRSR